MQPIWKTTYTVRAYETDAQGVAFPHTLFNYFQVMAADHADDLELGFHHVAEKRLFWVLSRVDLFIRRYPGWRDTVSAETWPKQTHRLLALRDLAMHAADGEELVRGTSGWLLVDLDTRRPVRPEPHLERVPRVRRPEAVTEPPAKVPPLEKALAHRVVYPGYTDTDMNGHVNSGNYVRWLLDCFPPEWHARHRLSRLSLNFLSEVRPGEEVILRWITNSDHTVNSRHEGMVGSERTVFRADLSWALG
jgi:acyl-ACP thioesterase